MSFEISRRELIQKTLASFGALSVPVALTACGDDKDLKILPSTSADFLHGVASGDPLKDRVILWTRLTPQDPAARLEVVWEIATDLNFANLVNSGKVQTTRAQDFTIKVDADKLSAQQTYYYRFRYGTKVSAIGQTKTLAEYTESVSFAVCSCSNYPAGYFHVYKEMAKQDLDVIIHLGDYIYEYGQGGYATEDAERLGRKLPADNNKEAISLDDYRKRYALYRTDLDLQAAHHRHPFIVIWDDHELANDAWKAGAENHQANEGSFETRKLAALQAYFEWMPIRPTAPNNFFNIYRQFNFGDLVQLNMLDTRILARDQQLSYTQYVTPQGVDLTRFQQDLNNPARTIMGHAQRDWLKLQLETSRATWNVLGQQVLMSRMLIPAELLPALVSVHSGNIDMEKIKQLGALIGELTALKVRIDLGDKTVTAEQKARLTTVVPYNLDAWDGYTAEREFIYQTLISQKKKVVVLAGDTHNAWSSALYAQSAQNQEKQHVGVELACSSVTSPGLEKYLNITQEQLEQFEYAFNMLIDELTYCNLNQRGYMLLNFDQKRLLSKWIFLDTVKDKQYKVIDGPRANRVSFNTNLLDPNGM